MSSIENIPEYTEATCAHCGYRIVPEYPDGREIEYTEGLVGPERDTPSEPNGWIHDASHYGHPSRIHRDPSNPHYTLHFAAPADGRSVELDKHMLNKAIEKDETDEEFDKITKGL